MVCSTHSETPRPLSLTVLHGRQGNNNKPNIPFLFFGNPLSIPTADEYFDRIYRIMSVLDEENIKIISAMKKFGPRNLQHISRRSKVPYPTVYTRVNKLEDEEILRTFAYPNYSKIGMARALVLLTPANGRELLAKEALKIPGYWIRIIRCSGECNGYYSLHTIPADNRQDFERYIEQL